MIRLGLLNNPRLQRGLAPYLALRQQRHHALHAFTPLQFLQKLGLVQPPRRPRTLQPNVLYFRHATSLSELPVDMTEPLHDEFPMEANNGEVSETAMTTIPGAKLVETEKEAGALWPDVSETAQPHSEPRMTPILADDLPPAKSPTSRFVSPLVLPPLDEQNKQASLLPSERKQREASVLKSPAAESVVPSRPQTTNTAGKESRAVDTAPPQAIPVAHFDENKIAPTISEKEYLSGKTSDEARSDSLLPLFTEETPRPPASVERAAESDTQVTSASSVNATVFEKNNEEGRTSSGRTIPAETQTTPETFSETGSAPPPVPVPEHFSEEAIALPPRRRRARIEEFASETSEPARREKPSDSPALAVPKAPVAAPTVNADAPPRTEATSARLSVAAEQNELVEPIAGTELTDHPPQYWYQRLVEAAQREVQAKAPTKQALLQQAATPSATPTPIADQRHGSPTRPSLNRPLTSNVASAGAPVRKMQSLPETPSRRFVAPRTAANSAAPETLSTATRQFLHPLLGLDPSLVPLRQDEVVAETLQENRADGFTDGEVIGIKPEYKQESPEFLGVLAHELTHVARQRQPRFVPPIARDVATQQPNTVGMMEEEAIARRVEGRVRQQAQFGSAPIPQDVWGLAEARTETSNAFAPVLASQPFDEGTAVPLPNWGGLPAPWEPMPEWNQVATTAEAMGISTSETTSLSPASITSSASATTAIQLAEEGRTLEAASGGLDTAKPTVPQPQPDLDSLARQVYSVLKRRLAAERRREYFE